MSDHANPSRTHPRDKTCCACFLKAGRWVLAGGLFSAAVMGLFA